MRQQLHIIVYTLWAYALTIRDIAPFGHNVVHTGNVRLMKHDTNA